MKSLGLILVLFLFVFTQVNGQEQVQKETPDEQIIVNKKIR